MVPRVRPPPGDVRRELGGVIGARRRRVGLTQEELANVVGCSLKAVRRYEQGCQNPPLDVLCRIARACDLPLSVFISPLDPIAARVPYRDWRPDADSGGDTSAA